MIQLEDAIEQLFTLYGGRRGFWGRHPDWELETWRRLVARDDTRLGYWEWVVWNILNDTYPESALEGRLQRALPAWYLLAWELNLEDIWILEADERENEREFQDEHPDYLVENWMYEVENDDTRRGYWMWVTSNLLADHY